MGDYIADLANNVSPPGDVCVLSVDSTSRDYDMTALAFNGATLNPNARDDVYLTILADGADVYLAIDNASARTINDTTAIAAGSALAFATGQCWKIGNGLVESYLVSRNYHKYLHIKTASGTGKVRIRASSPNTSAHR